MDNQNKEGNTDSRESYGIQISELLTALAEMKPPLSDTTRIDPRILSNPLSILKLTEEGIFNTRGSFRSRAVLPENISQLSNCQFKRRDHLKESLSASVSGPASSTAEVSSQEEQLQSSLPSVHPVILAHLVEKSKILPSDSISSIEEQLKKNEIQPHILGLQAWTKQQSCEPPSMLQKQLPQNVNLATTDILFLVCCVPFTATLHSLPSWIVGESMCQLVYYLQQVTAQATCITLSVMSVDRCYVTVYPLQSLKNRTPRTAVAVSVSIWIGSLLLSIPVAVYQRREEGYWFGPQTYCSEVFPSAHLQRVFIIYSFLVVYLLPLLTITTCYAFMLKRMGQPSVNPIDSSYQLQAQAERAAAVRARVSRMVVVMVALFLICWGPIQVCILLRAFGLRSYILYKLKIWGHCMSYSNSSINPLVYAFMGNNFRKAFKNAFPTIFLWCRRGRARVGNMDAEVEEEMDHQSPKGDAEMHFLSSGP